MTETIIIALISLVGTVIGAWSGVRAANKLTIYRIEQLEHKMDKHNNLIERMTIVEHDVCELKQEARDKKESVAL